MNINKNYQNLEDSYLFSTIAKKVNEYSALNPDKSINLALPYLKKVDMIVIMGVYPGFGGQKFIESVLDKIVGAKELIGDRNIDLEIDGGINTANVSEVTRRGVNMVVAGNTVFKAPDRKQIIAELRK